MNCSSCEYRGTGMYSPACFVDPIFCSAYFTIKSYEFIHKDTSRLERLIEQMNNEIDSLGTQEVKHGKQIKDRSTSILVYQKAIEIISGGDCGNYSQDPSWKSCIDSA